MYLFHKNQKGKAKMKTINKKSIAKIKDVTVKYLSLTTLVVGFIFAGFQLADNDTIVKCAFVLLAIFLTAKASK